jgi:hypothetical protein
MCLICHFTLFLSVRSHFWGDIAQSSLVLMKKFNEGRMVEEIRRRVKTGVNDLYGANR